MGREMAANLLTKTFQASDDAESTFVVHDHMEQATKRFLTDHTNLFPTPHRSQLLESPRIK
jgi:hypothetical protein